MVRASLFIEKMAVNLHFFSATEHSMQVEVVKRGARRRGRNSISVQKSGIREKG